MMWWVLLGIVFAVFAIPFVLEHRRKPVDPKAVKEAIGGYAELSGGITYYEWHGNLGGQIIVMVHGLTTPSWVFQGLVPGLTMMGFRVLAYDLYGRGLSERPYDAQTQEFFVTQLRELLKDQGIAKDFILFGYSMGGAIATAFTALESRRVARLILLAPAGLEYVTPKLLAKAAGLGKTGDWLWGLLGARALVKAAKSDAKRPTIIPDLVKRMRRETRTKGYLACILSSERNMLSNIQKEEHHALAESHVPVVSIWGDEDQVIPLSAVGKMTEWNRNAYKYVIPGAGHALGYTHPKEVLAAIQENFREV